MSTKRLVTTCVTAIIVCELGFAAAHAGEAHSSNTTTSSASLDSDLRQPFSGMWSTREGLGPGRRGRGFARGRPGRDSFGPSPEGRSGRGFPGPAALAPIEGGAEGLDRGDRMVRTLMTPEGQAAFDAMDPHDLPANNCLSPGLPSIVGVPFKLQEWTFEGDQLTIHHEYYDTRRVVDLSGAGHPVGLEHTHAGHAIGWFEGRTLVIETANLAATLGGLARNAPSSDARVVTEKYALSGDGTTLLVEMRIVDSKYLTRPLARRNALTRAESGAEIYEFPCDVEAASRHL